MVKQHLLELALLDHIIVIWPPNFSAFFLIFLIITHFGLFLILYLRLLGGAYVGRERHELDFLWHFKKMLHFCLFLYPNLFLYQTYRFLLCLRKGFSYNSCGFSLSFNFRGISDSLLLIVLVLLALLLLLILFALIRCWLLRLGLICSCR